MRFGDGSTVHTGPVDPMDPTGGDLSGFKVHVVHPSGWGHREVCERREDVKATIDRCYEKALKCVERRNALD